MGQPERQRSINPKSIANPNRQPEARMDKYRHYQQRNQRLSLLGYRNYEEYIKSEDWRKIRAKRLKDRPLCLLCSRLAEQVHHTSYADSVLLGLSNGALVSLCRECHCSIEFNGKHKRSLGEANGELFRLARAQGLRDWVGSTMSLLRRLKNKGYAQNRRSAE